MKLFSFHSEKLLPREGIDLDQPPFPGEAMRSHSRLEQKSDMKEVAWWWFESLCLIAPTSESPVDLLLFLLVFSTLVPFYSILCTFLTLIIVDKLLWGHLDGVMYSQRERDFILMDRYFQQITGPWLRLTSRPHKSCSVSKTVAGLPGKCTFCTLRGKPALSALPPPVQVWSATCFSQSHRGLLHVCAAPYPPVLSSAGSCSFPGLGSLGLATVSEDWD